MEGNLGLVFSPSFSYSSFGILFEHTTWSCTSSYVGFILLCVYEVYEVLRTLYSTRFDFHDNSSADAEDEIVEDNSASKPLQARCQAPC